MTSQENPLFLDVSQAEDAFIFIILSSYRLNDMLFI